MNTVSRYEIREYIGNEYSKSVFRQIVDRSRAAKIVKRLKKSGREVFMAKMKVVV